MRVCVVVPARDEAATLPALLLSLAAQLRPPAAIVVVDAGSVDATVAIARQVGLGSLRVVSIGPAFPGAARNAGISAAATDWVALIDAGCVADPGWLQALEAAALASPIPPGVVFGDYEPLLATEWDIAQALAIISPRDLTTGCRPPSTASLLVQRGVWERAGGFREDLRAAEDHLFFEALARAHVPTALAPQARVEWQLPAGPRAFLQKMTVYSAAQLAAQLGHRWHLRVVLMDLAFLSLLVLGIVSAPVLLAALALAAARLGRTLVRRRRNVAPRAWWRPDRVLRVAWLLLLADIAVWRGLGRWWRERRAGASRVG